MKSNRGFFIARKNDDDSHGDPIGNAEDSSIAMWQTLESAQKVLKDINEAGIDNVYIYYFDIAAIGRIVA